MKNIPREKKILAALAACDLVLVLLFAFSFIFRSKRNTIETRETVLLNASLLDSVSSIVLSEPGADGGTVTLTRNDSFWTGRDSMTDTIWPADSQTVRNLVDALVQVRTVRIKANSAEAWEGLSLDEDSAFALKVLDADSGEILCLYFGRTDALSQRVAFRTSRDAVSYETDLGIRSYLNAEASFWADPFLFPVFISGNARADMQSSYRHGTLLPVSPLPEQTLNVLKKTFENGSRAVFSVYETDEDIIVVPQFYAGSAMTDAEQAAVRKCSYRYSLSQWTFERILEEWKDE